MAERCGLFMIIALGESVLVTGATFADMSWTTEVVTGFSAAFVGSVAMWWIYFNVGAERGAATSPPRPTPAGSPAWPTPISTCRSSPASSSSRSPTRSSSRTRKANGRGVSILGGRRSISRQHPVQTDLGPRAAVPSGRPAASRRPGPYRHGRRALVTATAASCVLALVAAWEWRSLGRLRAGACRDPAARVLSSRHRPRLEGNAVAGCCTDHHCRAPGALDSPAWRRALWLALAANAGMFLAEIVAGVAAGSSSLQADALDFLGDAANYAISLGVAGMALTWRARAALLKGASLGGLGLWVLASTAWHAWAGTLPAAGVMGIVGVLALLTNGGVALMLYRFRSGDANMRSVWICRATTRSAILRSCWRHSGCSAPAPAGRTSSSPRSWPGSASAAAGRSCARPPASCAPIPRRRPRSSRLPAPAGCRSRHTTAGADPSTKSC